MFVHLMDSHLNIVVVSFKVPKDKVVSESLLSIYKKLLDDRQKNKLLSNNNVNNIPTIYHQQIQLYKQFSLMMFDSGYHRKLIVD